MGNDFCEAVPVEPERFVVAVDDSHHARRACLSLYTSTDCERWDEQAVSGGHDGDGISWESEDRFAVDGRPECWLAGALGEFMEDGLGADRFDNRGDMVVVAH